MVRKTPKATISTAPPIGTLARGLSLLTCVAASRGRIPLAELTKRSRLNKVTVHRLATKLVDLGYLERDHEGALRLGVRVLELGFSYLASLDLRTQALPEMRKLVAELGTSIGLSVLDGDHIIYVERLEPPGLPRFVPVGIGAHMPIHATAMGKAIVAFLPSADQDAILGRLNFVPFTKRTIADRQGLARELALTRARGFGFSDQEFLDGYRGIAAPILDGAGVPVGALSAGAFVSHRNLRELRDEIGPQLVRAGRIIGGYRSNN